MNSKVLLVVSVVAVVSSSHVGYAHHSQEATYDSTKEITLQGQLALVNYRNPHVFLQLDVPGAKGKPERWAIEWSGTAGLTGQGVTRDTFRPGDRLRITAAPSRTCGEHRAKMNTLHRPSDGFTWGKRPGEVVD